MSDITTEIKENNKNEPCGICGENHLLENCSLITIKYHVLHTEIPSKARLTLPNFLEVKKLVDHTYDVVTLNPILKGTQFGPFEANKSSTMKPEIDFPLKIFLKNQGECKEYFLDTSDENECSWMIFISPANELKEQNLICYQDQNEIYYSSIRDIQKGESLKVWYSPYYAKQMNKKVLVSKNLEDTPDFYTRNVNYLVQKQQNIMARDIWSCKFCDKTELNIVVFAKHLLEHYEMKTKKICEICKESFSNRMMLHKHQKFLHGISKAIKIVPRKNENTFGGPLLNDNCFDNFLLQQTCTSNFNSIDNSNILTENNDNEQLFDIEINCEENEKIICDICLKGYTKLKSLIEHLKIHTGQFYCKECNKIFCRKETFSNHHCRTKGITFKCNYCSKMFYLKKYLNQHVLAKHIKQYHCIRCDKFYSNKFELTRHNCTKVPLNEKKQFKCNICDKIFYRDRYLREHQKRHQMTKVQFKLEVVCELCSAKYNSKSSLRRHLKCAHKTETDKKDSNIKENQEVECSICKKKIKSNNLRQHLITHSNKKKYKCDSCSSSFKFITSLFKHKRNKHKINSKEVENLTETKTYSCPKCDKRMKIRGSLNRHLKRAHNDYYNEIKSTKMTNKLNIQNKNHENDFSLMDSIENMDFSNMGSGNDLNIDDILNNTSNMDNFLAINDSNDKIVENLLNNIGKKTDEREVCLSMPDLSENDQEIQLGKNAYILENGTIVEPQENSDNVVIYLLDQKF